MSYSRQITRALSLLLSVVALAQAPPEANKLVVLNEIKIEGSHLPENGVARLSGLARGEKVNDLIVNAACHKITASGLVKSVSYAYDVYTDKPGVTLVLTLVDEKPLLPATIIPKSDEELLWRTAQSADPLLTRELPRTEAALRFYTSRLEAALKSMGRDKEYVSAKVTGDADGNASRIVFEIRAYRQPQPGKRTEAGLSLVH